MVTEKAWIPPQNFLYANENPAEFRAFYEHENPRLNKYFISFYNAVIQMKGNEISPRANTEILVCVLFLIIDLIVTGNTFGSVAVLVQMSNRKSAMFQNQIDVANTAMKNMNVP